MKSLNDEAIGDLLERSVRLVDKVPTELRPAALSEVLRLLAEVDAPPDATGAAGGNIEHPRRMSSLSRRVEEPTLPEAIIVKEKGTRLHKAVYAAAVLVTEGEEASLGGIERFVADRLADRLSKPATVLKGAVPQYLSRTKGKSGFVYKPTDAGLRLLAVLEPPE